MHIYGYVSIFLMTHVYINLLNLNYLNFYEFNYFNYASKVFLHERLT